MRVIITGDRKFRDYPWLSKKCLDVFTQLQREGYNTERSTLEILTAKAKGPESLACLFAENHNLKIKVFSMVNAGGIAPAYEKNQMMVDYAAEDPELGVVIAFWTGTGIVVNDLINKAAWRKLKIFEIRI